jgi:hypothetical protein
MLTALAQIFIGNSPRLMRLNPASFCASDCVRVNNIQMKGTFVQDPGDPGHCSPTNNAFNKVSVRLSHDQLPGPGLLQKQGSVRRGHGRLPRGLGDTGNANTR